MCELLVMARDNHHADHEKDRRGCYKTGDIVVIKPDGHEWGANEGLPAFEVVKFAGVSVEDFAHYDKAKSEKLSDIASPILSKIPALLKGVSQTKIRADLMRREYAVIDGNLTRKT